jgi:WhiB family redox-sensing transcriptional regulator
MAAVEFVGVEHVEDEWMRDAACKGLTHLFFPSSAERPQARERREATARQVCATCSVTAHCREFARLHHEYGFWGGESEDERHAAGYRLIAPIGVRARAV